MTEPRLFTVAKANRALPLVRRIVDDILAEHPRWKDLIARYELAAAGVRAETGETPEMRELRRLVTESAERINGFIEELEAVGCVLKGVDQGLVDFYGLHQGRVVCLCWRHGEAAVEHWHELDAGFAGRRPITPDFHAAEAPAR
jgi:hypothetical protein